MRGLFGPWARAPFFLLPTGWIRMLGREEERHQSMSHPSSVSQELGGPHFIEFSWTSLLTSSSLIFPLC